MYKKTLISIFTLALIVPFVASAAGFSDHWFNWLKKDQAAQVVKFSANIQDQTFARGDRDDSIKEIQEALSDMGIYKGWISGALGPKTEEAIATFQNQNGLELTGKLDKKTYDAIVNGVLKDNNSRGGGQSGSGNQPLTALEAMCNQNNPLWVKVLSPADNSQNASNYVAQPVFALCRMAGLEANNSLSIRMEYGGFVDVIQGQTNISNSTVFDVTNPYPNIWYIEYLPGIDFANDYDGDGEYEIKAIFHNDIYPGVDAMDEVSIQIGSGQSVNAPLYIVKYGVVEDIYTEANGSEVGVFTFLGNIKNTSNETIYFSNACGHNSNGFSVRLERFVNNNQTITEAPFNSSCSIGFLGSGNQYGSFIEPGVDRDIFLTFLADPVNSGQYRVIIDGMQYSTPLQNSPVDSLSLYPQTHPLANPWDEMVSSPINID